MGKIRTVKLGDEEQEKEQARRADARREAKKAKKTKPEDVESGVKTQESDVIEKGTKESKVKKQDSDKKAPKQKSKRYTAAVQMVDRTKLYSISEAVALVKKTSLTTFDGTVEIHVNLNQEMLGGKNDYRGTVTLPHGTGKQVRVVIADDAVIAQLEAGKIEFEILIAHPSMMPKLAKFARTLGPRGLMPNPKSGTVSPDPEKRAAELSGGQINYKTEPVAAIIHLPIGKVSYEETQLQENIQALFLSIGKNKISKATISSTMGPGIKIDPTSV